MKQKLLLLLVLAFTMNLQAQDKVWDFGTWDVNPDGILTTTVVDGLTLEPTADPAMSVFGVIEAKTGKEFPDGYISVNRFKTNNSNTDPNGDASDPAVNVGYKPLERYFSFDVDGPVDIKIWFRNKDSERSIWVTDGTSEIMHHDAGANTDYLLMEGAYSGGAGTVYVFCVKGGLDFFKIQVSPVAKLSTNDLGSKVSSNVRSFEKTVFVSDVKMDTEINLYSISGALIKSIKTSSDTNFSVSKAGIYIATLKTAEGEKSVKLIVQ